LSQPSLENSAESSASDRSWWYHSFLPFRKAIVRGLAVVTPPLLTIVLFLWAWNIIDSYVLRPVEAAARHAIVWSIADVRDDRQITTELANTGRDSSAIDRSASPPVYVAADGTRLVKINQQWIPQHVFDLVETSPGDPRPDSANAYYHRFVRLEFLPRHLVIPAFLSVFILALYLLGRFFTFGIGRWLWAYIESLIGRLPIVSNVYSSVKQVTDFAFSENELQFTRVVAVEYPRKGLWTIGFVTGESMLDIRTAANEPVVSVLMPTSPMPATGFVISVPKSQTIDLNITMDQAIQWCVSCGVVVPPHQQVRTLSPSTAASPIPLPPTSELSSERLSEAASGDLPARPSEHE
jgi:uncharacterized membrane protein